MTKKDFSYAIAFLSVIILLEFVIIFGLIILLITVSESKNKVIYELENEVIELEQRIV